MSVSLQEGLYGLCKMRMDSDADYPGPRPERVDDAAFDAEGLRERLMALPFMQGAPEIALKLLPCGALREHCYEKKRILEREKP